MSNHLIIGLGGTGGKIIRALRKTIFQEFRDEMDTPGKKVSLGYLYLDSDDSMMRLDDPTWKILGHSVQIPKASQVVIKGADLKERLDSINSYPGIRPWIGDKEQWNDILNSIVGEALGGQKRRLGRFLFACSVDRFMTALREQVQLVRRRNPSGESDVTFHVLCGLAGGTGSGTVVDVVSQIRKEFPKINERVQNRIIIYAGLPDRHPKPGWDTGNYHANGYAALCELNALSTGQYRPFDVTAVRTRRDDSGQMAAVRLENQDPFNGCYVFTNENENGLAVDVEQELPHIVANFLYHKVIVVKDVKWEGLLKAENAENGDGSAEMDREGGDGEEDGRGKGRPVRSKRFLTFGIKRLAFPEKEIREFLVYSYARQVVLQLRYNNWQDTLGYVEKPQNRAFQEVVRHRDTLSRWLLSDDHLTLSTGILPHDRNNKSWKPISEEWTDVMPRLVSFVKENKPKTDWINELSTLCEKRFSEDYRGLGVPRLYELKFAARKDLVQEVRDVIEADLFGEWENGQKSMEDISRLLAALTDMLEEKLHGIDATLERLKNHLSEQEANIQHNKVTWAKIGPLAAALLKKRDNVLNHHQVCLEKYYTYRTQIEAWRFAKKVMPVLIDELRALSSDVDECMQVVHLAYDTFSTRINSRLQDTWRHPAALKKELVRFYDPALVKTVARRWIANEAEQKKQTAAARRALIKELGPSPTFTLFRANLGPNRLVETLEKECETKVDVAHSELINDPNEKLLGVSVIDKLKDRYAGKPDDLKQFITQLVEHAGNFVFFDNAEISRSGLGCSRNSMQDTLSILSALPMPPSVPPEGSFEKDLKTVLENSAIGRKEFVSSTVNPYEIALVKITNLFPLRYLSHVKWLKERYDARVASDSTGRARMEVHTEGNGTSFLSLFPPTQDEIDGLREQERSAVTPYLLLGKVMNLIQQSTDERTGRSAWVLHWQNVSGLPERTTLGESFLSARSTLHMHDLEIIRDEVQKRLEGSFLHLDQRGALTSRIQQEVGDILAELGHGDDLFQRFKEDAENAIRILDLGGMSDGRQERKVHKLR